MNIHEPLFQKKYVAGGFFLLLALIIAGAFSGFVTLPFSLHSLRASIGQVVFPAPSINSLPASSLPQSTPAAILATSTAVYLGGSFSGFGDTTGPGVPIVIATNHTAATFPKINDGAFVSISISDGAGGWYVGGTFSTIGGVSRNNLAHILANGTVDLSFNPPLLTDNSVSKLKLSNDRSTLYVFVNGVTRVVASLSTADGSVLHTFLSATAVDPSGIDLSPDGTIFYLSYFDEDLNGSVLDAFLTADNSPLPGFDASAAVGSGQVGAIGLSVDGSILYFGFNKLNADFVAINALTGASIPGFSATTDSVVSHIIPSPDGTRLYLSGNFAVVNGVTTGPVAALSTTDGSLVSGFKPVSEFTNQQQANSIALSSNGATLFVGGNFTHVQGGTRHNLAAFSTTDGSLVSAFTVGADSIIQTVSLSQDETQLYTAGQYSYIAEKLHIGLVALSPSTSLPLNNFNAVLDEGEVLSFALSPDGRTLYAAGNFSGVNGISRSNIVALNTSDGAVVSAFNVAMDSNDAILKIVLSEDGSTLYAGGFFSTIGGKSRSNLAAINTADGTVLDSFVPDPDASVDSLVLSRDGSHLFVGGDFTTIASASRSGLAELVAADGAIVPAFAPDALDGTPKALALSPDETTLYAGGNFGNIGTQAQIGLAAFSVADGSVIQSFLPVLDSQVSDFTLSSDGLHLFIAGFFSTVNSTPEGGVAEISTTDGSLGDFQISDFTFANIIARSADTRDMYIAGSLSLARYRGHFPFSVNVSSSTLAATEGGIGDSYTLVLNEQPTADVTIAINPNSQVAVTPSSVTFTTLNWDVPQSVTVSAINDGVAEGAHTGTIAHSVTSADSNYNGISVASVTVNITDGITSSSGTTRTVGSGNGAIVDTGKLSPSNLGTKGTSTRATKLIPGIATSSSSIVIGGGGIATSTLFFLHPMRVGEISIDSLRLQAFLNAHGFLIASSGPGSRGNETLKYGAKTAAAVARFQEKYAKEILTPFGLKKGTGIVGKATLRKLNEIIDTEHWTI